MKIIANPLTVNGKKSSSIHDFWYKDVKYFDSKKAEEFNPGDVGRFEDDFGEYLLYTYPFLEQVTAAEAKRRMEKKEKAVTVMCDHPGCDFVTDTPVALTGHKRVHEGEDLIPMIGGTKKADKIADIDKFYRDSEAQALRDGLEGEGVRHDTPTM